MTDVADKTLETVLVNIIDKVTSGVDKAIEFSAEQLPDIVQQLILFNTVKLIALCFVFICIIYFYYKTCVKISRADRGDFWYRDDIPAIPFLIFGTVGAVGCIIGFCENIFDLFKITLAPKIWLIEHAAELVK